jgi:DNA-binding MurR/RpiR family transcriptional regulator
LPYRHLAQLLDARFAALSPELQRAARWVREHPAELGLQSMRQSARAAGVAPATMTRLAQALGLEGFDAMRRPAMAALARSAAQASADEAPPGVAPISALQQAQSLNVTSVAVRNSIDQLQAAAAAILAARQVVFLGQRASFGIAHHLRYTCDWLRAGTQLVANPAGAGNDELAELTQADLLVAVSQAPYSVQTVQCAQQAQSRGVPVLALTDSALSPLARTASIVLLFDAASPSFFHSMTGVQALAETLMAAVAEQGGAAVVQRLSDRQQRLQNDRVYWDKPNRQRRATA